MNTLLEDSESQEPLQLPQENQNSEGIRNDLHRQLSSRRQSFTPKEFKFLSNIALKGNDEEVNLAKKKLSDTDLFFDVPGNRRYKRSQSVKLINGLKTRRKSVLHSDIWKAHEKDVKRTSDKEFQRGKAPPSSSNRLPPTRRSSISFSKNISILENCRVIRKEVHQSVVRRSSAVEFQGSNSGLNSANFSTESLSTLPLTESEEEKKDNLDFDCQQNIPFTKSEEEENANLDTICEQLVYGQSADSSVKEEPTFNNIPFTESEEEENGNLNAICEQLVHGPNTSIIDSFAKDENKNFTQHESRNDPPPQRARFSIKVITRPEIIEDSNDGMGFEVYDELYTYDYDCEDEDVISITIEDERMNVWNDMDEDEFEYEDGLTFHIFGTSASDLSAQPHVLSPPLMNSLRNFLPYSVSDQNYWLKSSLVRDGADLMTLLQHIRGAKHTIIAIETVEGEVFGSFTSTPWQKQFGFFGNGEAFLWRMRRNRNDICQSIEELTMMESKLETYNWSGENYMIQFCQHNRIGVGGGECGSSSSFGFALDSDLLFGTTGSCATFQNPPLAKYGEDGTFEVMNLEVWAFTPCETEEEAEKLEFGNLFFADALKQAHGKYC